MLGSEGGAEPNDEGEGARGVPPNAAGTGRGGWPKQKKELGGGWANEGEDPNGEAGGGGKAEEAGKVLPNDDPCP